MLEPSQPVTVFVIDDNDVDIEAVHRAFRRVKIGNPIAVAHDGKEALQMLRAGEVPSPYIILLDLNMPGMDGLTFLEELRADDQLRSSVVFIVTTSDAARDLQASYQLNVAGYVVKGKIGDDFLRLTGLLENYWKVVTLPEGE